MGTLSFRVDEEIADEMKRLAAARPLVALGAAYAVAVLFASPDLALARARAWMAFGEAPLDVVERELLAVTSSSPPPASPRP